MDLHERLRRFRIDDRPLRVSLTEAHQAIFGRILCALGKADEGAGCFWIRGVPWRSTRSGHDLGHGRCRT
jgi:hypothetical protein